MNFDPKITRTGLTQAALDVIDERTRQVDGEGFSFKRDDEYIQSELPKAAACFAFAGSTGMSREALLHLWPSTWSANWFKIVEPRRLYVKAAALLLAEIERIDRKAP